MAGPWEKYQQGTPQASAPAAGPWSKYAQQEDKSYSGQILPFSVDAEGNKHFDSNAGVLGAIKNAFLLPGQAMKGEVDPTSEEGIARATDFAATFSPMNPAIRAGEAVVPGVKTTFRKPDIAPPSQQALRDASAMDYEKIRDLGVDYTTKSVNDLSRGIQAKLNEDGVIGTLAPKTYSVLAELEKSPEGSVASISGLQGARRAFGNAAADFSNPTEQLAAKRAIESLDEFLARSDPATVSSGPAELVPGLLEDARGNYAAAKRSQRLTDLDRAAELRANAANSGANSGNTTRQRLASLLLNKKQIAGFNQDEQAALEAVNKGGLGANISRRIGNMLGGGGGIGASLIGLAGAAGGAVSGHPEAAMAGASLPLVGTVSRELSNLLTERALRQVERDVRKRSPLYERMLKDAPSEAGIPSKTAALVRALMLAETPNGGSGY